MTKETKRCPSCGSSNIHKKGFTKYKVQRYVCRQCNRKFCEGSEKKHIRLLFANDWHVGHRNGMINKSNLDIANSFQKEMQVWFENMVNLIKPIHVIAGVGDLIDGKGNKNGGAEIIIPSNIMQAKAAAEIINSIGAQKIYMVKGTPYHTGKDDDFEQIIADAVGAEKLQNSMYLRVNDCVIAMRHKVGRSTVQYGKATPLLKEYAWEQFMKQDGDPDVNILIRAHVHYFFYAGFSNHVSMTLPSLQGASDFGEKECTGNTDLGIVYVDIYENGLFDWHYMKFVPSAPRMDVVECEV